ncbi:MAG: response regulator transcription factor [Chloroflexota bacterium]|nr:response regulator transcription factor [Chloroflexota bacterium]
MNKSNQSIRVLIAADHPVVREGIRAVLEKVVDMEVVGEASEGRTVQELVAALQPDILLLDLIMPGPRSADIARWVRHYYPETVTLILTAHDRDAFLAEMEQAGAVGYLTKEEDFPTLVAALRRAAQGEVLFSGEQLWRAHRWRQEVRALGISNRAGARGRTAAGSRSA